MKSLVRQWSVACVFVLADANAVQAVDPTKGESLYEKCHACHAIKQQGVTLGPSLVGIFGRKAGSLEQFRYSPAMRRSSLVWDDATLDSFLTDPQALVPGNRMPFAGMSEKSDRDDLIAYLHKATEQ
ncbi:cytochrome c family protein [Bradyrhizobium frederickii]|uniref:Cytochrome c family protein n=1 Tax=Bradyrhizobium frederickii TaxID=2560054 RepID=A0A4Y9L6I1_9BRAD|nr:cytochrome c family protein [Bradyrhizobium frederickii]TFV37643.1 cytochrome c family protein [Bradyrhizobium frederickii]